MQGPRFLPRRELGRTGFRATRLGIGDLADRSVPLADCVKTLRRALDFGLNLVDTAPGYEAGYSEEIVGAALREHAGPQPFVIDKIDELEKPVPPQVSQSLARLGRASVDCLAFHNVSSVAAYEALLARGALAELDECRRRGQCRFVGFSSHHPEVLERALAANWADILMFPVGPFVDRRYTDQILPRARQLGVGTVCFKTFGAGKLLGDTQGYGRPLAERPRGKLSSGGSDASTPSLPRLSVEDCVRVTLTHDPDVALLGLSFPNEQDAALAAAENFAPLTDEELAALRARAIHAIAGKGPCWWNPPHEIP
jgi:aryl-alcohol dehydrogenase-like predicted oxidoreductase